MKVDDELRALITQKREALGWSGARLATEAGTSQQNVQRIERGDVQFSRAVPLVLKALGIKPGLVAKPDSAPAIGVPIEAEELVGDRDLPVYASAAGGKGQMIVSVEPMQYVKRPDRLIGVRKGYGIIVVGDSMEPAFWHGDIALVHPYLALRSNVDVVLYKGSDTDGREAIIKRLVRDAGETYKLRQWNPPEGEPRDFDEDKADWPICHHVVGRYAGR